MRKDKKSRKIQICPTCGKENDREFKDGYCRKHQHQLKKYGHIIDNSDTTKFESNVFITEREVTKLITRNVLGKDTATFTFDTEDLDIVKRYKWRLGKDGYCTSGYSSLRLHRLVMNVKKGGQVDHINGDITDNRKINLRLATNSLNQANKRAYSNSGYKGIEFRHSKKYGNRFYATIRREDTQFISPVFNTIDKACYARYLMETWVWDGKPLIQTNNYTLSEEEMIDVEYRMESIKSKINTWLSSHNIEI